VADSTNSSIQKGSREWSNPASLILDNALDGGPSGLDEETITWSRATADELARTVSGIQDSADFGAELVTLVAGSRREVSLLAVELLALTLLPLGSANGKNEDLFRRLVANVVGEPVVVPEALLAGIVGAGHRPPRSDDDLGARFLWLVKYIETYGTCPDFIWLVERGDDEYIGHEDLHDRCVFELVTESPWAAAEFSNQVPADCKSMRYELDHMLWPEELAPLNIREEADRILGDNLDLLRENSGKSEIAMLKDLYLLKQMRGSWAELTLGMTPSASTLGSLRERPML
jgi:hypothetical protein